MNELTGGKLNKGGYVLRPYSFFENVDGRRPSHLETMLKGVVYSFARAKLPCNYGYKTFTNRLHISKSSVARKMALIKDDEKFHVQRNGGKNSTCTYEGELLLGFIVTPDFFKTTEFKIAGKKRRLTGSEVDLLSLIYSHTFDGGNFVASYETIAEKMNYASVKTICRAVKTLFAMDLICRPTKGTRHNKNVFKVQMSTLRKYEQADRKAKRRASLRKQGSVEVLRKEDAISAADARADRERFYSMRRAEADRIAARNEEKVKSMPRYREVARRLRELEIEFAKAEFNDPSKLPALRLEKKALTVEKTTLLKKVGLTLSDITAHYACQKCSDTGFMPDGKGCDCYRSRGAP